jgi:hypothetical protein
MVLNTDSNTIATLVYHGVTIDESVYDVNDKKQKFIASMVPEVEVSDAPAIVPWLHEIGCDAVYLNSYRYTHTEVVKHMIDLLQKTKIDIILEDTIIKKKYNFPVVIGFKNNSSMLTQKFAKIVRMVDSTLVEIK